MVAQQIEPYLVDTEAISWWSVHCFFSVTFNTMVFIFNLLTHLPHLAYFHVRHHAKTSFVPKIAVKWRDNQRSLFLICVCRQRGKPWHLSHILGIFGPAWGHAGLQLFCISFVKVEQPYKMPPHLQYYIGVIIHNIQWLL